MIETSIKHKPSKSVGAIIYGLHQDSPTTALPFTLTERPKARALELIWQPTETGTKALLAIVIGLPEPKLVSSSLVKQLIGQAVKVCIEHKISQVAIDLAGFLTENSVISPFDLAQSATLAAHLSDYRFDRYKTERELPATRLTDFELIVDPETDMSQYYAGSTQAEAIAGAILNSRDLINQPPNVVTPSAVAKAALEISQLSNSMTVTVYDKTELEEMGVNTLLAVASGSDQSPYLIHLHYKPTRLLRSDGSKRPSVALVGKGVTFDSGGLGIKPWGAMLSMKADMAGAGAVFGIFQALAELEAIGQPIQIQVHGIIATTENMISGSAMRPDDIIKSYSGKTIEIIHTDAEGRLILADALTYATKQKPDYILDFATLTGTAIKALGKEYAAVMSNNLTLMEKIESASVVSGEKLWPLPLPEEYREMIVSSVADLQNISTNPMSPDAIIGGLFLKEFVGDIPWAHLDIAGPAYSDEVDKTQMTKGATGYGILLALALLKSLE